MNANDKQYFNTEENTDPLVSCAERWGGADLYSAVLVENMDGSGGTYAIYAASRSGGKRFYFELVGTGEFGIAPQVPGSVRGAFFPEEEEESLRGAVEKWASSEESDVWISRLDIADVDAISRLASWSPAPVFFGDQEARRLASQDANGHLAFRDVDSEEDIVRVLRPGMPIGRDLPDFFGKTAQVGASIHVFDDFVVMSQIRHRDKTIVVLSENDGLMFSTALEFFPPAASGGRYGSFKGAFETVEITCHGFGTFEDIVRAVESARAGKEG